MVARQHLRIVFHSCREAEQLTDCREKRFQLFAADSNVVIVEDCNGSFLRLDDGRSHFSFLYKLGLCDNGWLLWFCGVSCRRGFRARHAMQQSRYRFFRGCATRPQLGSSIRESVGGCEEERDLLRRQCCA
jgi:hypothetical protein